MNGDEALPPNFLPGRGLEMGPWEIPMELSANDFAGALSVSCAVHCAARAGGDSCRLLSFTERLSVGKPLHIRKEANFL